MSTPLPRHKPCLRYLGAMIVMEQVRSNLRTALVHLADLERSLRPGQQAALIAQLRAGIGAAADMLTAALKNRGAHGRG